MAQPSPNQSKLQNLLRELFQLNQPDLDFGLYRIMHAKAQEIEQFLNEDLLATIQQRLGGNKAEKVKKAKAAYESKRQNLAADKHPNPDTADSVKLLKAEYELAQQSADDDEDLYEQLYRFFERYYDSGDFLSRRYYGRETSEKGAPYAVPYDGSEVYLHWANKDQYYIKTTESFRQFSVDLAQAKLNATELFTSQGPGKLHFALVEAEEGAHNNVKATNDKERYFIVDADAPLEWQGDELTVRFHYRADEEKPAKGRNWREERNKRNETIILAALEKQSAQKGEHAERARRYHQALNADIPKGKDGTQKLLAKYLNQYTAKNSMDYFIHKDLGGFLKRELDYYLKNELFRLDELGSEKQPNTKNYERQLQKALTLREVAHKLIAFLAQTEEFQKKLWLKKKFVVDAQWLVTLDKVPAELYPQIEANDAQWAEWEKLGFVAAKAKRKALLKPESRLVLDTQFFDAGFTAQLLASIHNLDEATDGVLVHSENFQALNLMQERYREQVKCVYIDPPYNTGSDGFCYKDQYQHSSWASMLHDRVAAGRGFLTAHGAIFASIDEVEQPNLRLLMDSVFGGQNFVADMVWAAGRKNDSRLISVSHEYIVAYANSREYLSANKVEWRQRKKGLKDIYAQHAKLKREHGTDYAAMTTGMKGWFKGLANSHQAKGHKHYCQVDQRGVYFAADISWPGGGGPKYEVLHPRTKKPVKIPARGWITPDPKNMQQWIDDDRIHFGDDENAVPCLKKYLADSELQTPYSVFYQDGRAATKRLREILGVDDFGFPKDEAVLAEIFEMLSESCLLVLDYFAGSGTTGHAVIKLNREDNGKRKYILVEMGDYFDTVLKPRIAKVIYSADWKDGKPTAPETGISQLVKVIRLESYEDTLNNLQVKEKSAQSKVVEVNPALREDYFLHYLLALETQGSPSLLNVAQFADPTAYTLRVKQAGSDAQVQRAVDLVETFNWLLGLRVSKLFAPQVFTAKFAKERDAELGKDAEPRKTLKAPLSPASGEANGWWFRTVQGVDADGRAVWVVWRKLTSDPAQDNLVLEAYLREQMGFDVRKLDSLPCAVLYVNGSHALPNMPHCEVRQLEEAFHRLMWDVKDA